MGPTSLLTDSYELTMVHSYWKEQMRDMAVFELAARKLPKTRRFLVAAGLEPVLDFLENFRFEKAELDWLSRTQRWERSFIDFLADFRFEGEVLAMPEGSLFFENEPIIQIIAPIHQAQLVETRVMNLMHYPTLVASKAARCYLSARGAQLIEFGMRRAPGGDAAISSARASYLAGFDGTSDVMAAYLHGIPAFGTMAHSYIEAHASEAEAFKEFSRSYSNRVTLLIDTYDTEKGAEIVAKMAPALAAERIRISAVRLDSGDLAQHARNVRAILDRNNLRETRIFASGNVDEFEIARLLKSGAPIDGFGIGTKLVTSSDAPSLDFAYKLQEYAGIPRRKTSEKKITWPGRKQVWRLSDPSGTLTEDTVGLQSETLPGEPLLVPVMRNGRRLEEPRELDTIRSHCLRELSRLPRDLAGPEGTARYPVQISPGLRDLVRTMDEADSVRRQGAA